MNKVIFLSSFLHVQISMSAQPTLASVDQVPATTLWATTPASVPLNTCRSTEGTTAWVSARRFFLTDLKKKNILSSRLLIKAQRVKGKTFSSIFLLVMQTWGRACVTATSTTHARTSCPSTWPRRCAAAPTMLERPGTNRASPVQLLLPVSVTRHPETHSGTTVKTCPSLRICSCLFQLSTSYCVVTRLLASSSTSTLASP